MSFLNPYEFYKTFLIMDFFLIWSNHEFYIVFRRSIPHYSQDWGFIIFRANITIFRVH